MTPTDTYLGLRAFVDELVRCGVREACTSPGSRNTPLLLSLARNRRLRATSHLDERCGGFFALGAAKASAVPAVLACTSGTAAANYLPAVVEAWEARVGLLVLTADRPPELRDLGAGQTIDQVKLYGRHAKWYLEVDDAPATPERLRWLRQLACRAVWTATSGRPGPVHLNFSLREPLVLEEDLPADEGGRALGALPLVDLVAPAPDPQLVARVERDVAGYEDVLVVAGRMDDAEAGRAVAAFAERANVPLLADPLSNARLGAAIAHYDLFLRDPAWARAHTPGLVLRAGDLPTSKPLRQWLAGLHCVQVALDPHGAWQDPAGVLDAIVPLDPRALAGAHPARGRQEWFDDWRVADERAHRAIADTLPAAEVSEPLVVARTAAMLGATDTLVVASSMPVRDLEAYAVATHAPPRILANRGANGIDGLVSTAFGVAAASSGRTVLLIGDVALAHDIGGLIAARRLALALTIVLINNDGGGIFHFLPVAGQADAFEEHVATPHGLDFAQAAELYGVVHHRPRTMADFDVALEQALAAPGTAIVEVRTGREANRALHERVAGAVRAAL